MDEVRRQFSAGALDAVELFRGGGNDTILFKDDASFLAANAAYTRFVLEKHPGLLPLCVGVEVEGRDYREDYAALMAEADRRKNAMQAGRVENAQPFARKDRTTLQAISVEIRHGNEVEYRTAEADAKYRKGTRSEKTEEATRLLDALAKDDERSLLAIVHADGNSMGVKIQKKLGDHADYDYCVNTMRAFTQEIKTVFSEKGKDALEKRRKALVEAYPDERLENLMVRWIVTDGDDATFLCNAKYALELTKAYLKGVKAAGDEVGVSYSSCAGICVFHAHYPFARAYELAEQACDNAKKKVHQTELEQAWVDFHFIHSGVNGDLEDIRDLHGTKDCIARPWFVCGEAPPLHGNLKQLEELNRTFHEFKVNRGQIKTLGAELEGLKEAGEQVWKRLCYNTPGLKGKTDTLFQNEDAMYRAFYDLSDFYDIWFRRGGGEGG